MNINNKERSRKISRVLSGIIILYLTALAAFAYYEQYLGVGVVFTIAVFSILFFRIIDFQYIELTDELGIIELKYYSINPFQKREYNAFRFSSDRLEKAEIKSQLGGLLAQLEITVLTEVGPATYPPVSISGVKKTDRLTILKYLKEVISQNLTRFN